MRVKVGWDGEGWIIDIEESRISWGHDDPQGGVDALLELLDIVGVEASEEDFS